MPEDRPIALVTALFRGEGLERLRGLCELVLDPWIDYRPLRLYADEELAERIKAEGADIVICEGDFCFGPVLDLPLRAIGSTRATPPARGRRPRHREGHPRPERPGRNADGVAEMTVALLLACTGGGTRRRRCPRRPGVQGRHHPYQRYRAWQLAGRTAGLVGLGAVGRATKWRLEGLGMRVIAADPSRLMPPTSWTTCWASPTWCQCTMVTPDTTGMMGPTSSRPCRRARCTSTPPGPPSTTQRAHRGAQSGRLAAAGLDHFEGETTPDRPSPHRHGQRGVDAPHRRRHHDTEANHSTLIADGLAQLLAGEKPDNCVNPEVL